MSAERQVAWLGLLGLAFGGGLLLLVFRTSSVGEVIAAAPTDPESPVQDFNRANFRMNELFGKDPRVADAKLTGTTVLSSSGQEVWALALRWAPAHQLSSPDVQLLNQQACNGIAQARDAGTFPARFEAVVVMAVDRADAGVPLFDRSVVAYCAEGTQLTEAQVQELLVAGAP